MISNTLDCNMIKSVVPVLLFKEMVTSSDKSGDSLRFLSSPFVHILMLNTKGLILYIFWCSAQKSTNTENPTTNPKKFNVWVHLGLGFVLIWIDPARKGKPSKKWAIKFSAILAHNQAIMSSTPRWNKHNQSSAK